MSSADVADFILRVVVMNGTLPIIDVIAGVKLTHPAG
jgi:hypothetical protein